MKDNIESFADICSCYFFLTKYNGSVFYGCETWSLIL